MFQGKGDAAPAALPKGELAMPGVAYGKGGDNPFVKKLAQANRDVNFPEERNVFGRIEAGGESSKHIGRP